MPVTSRRRRLLRRTAPLVLAAFLPAASGCFGGFHLTRKVYDWNQQVSEDRWLQWLAFLVLNVVPVYPFATVVDAFFANAWEFWAGENPVLSQGEAPTRVVRGPEGSVLRATRLGPRHLRLELTAPDGETRHLILRGEGDGAVARDAETGEVLARLAEVGGRPVPVPAR